MRRTFESRTRLAGLVGAGSRVKRGCRGGMRACWRVCTLRPSRPTFLRRASLGSTLGLGELDEAFAWMNRAIDERDPMMTPIRSYPFFDPIRADPRFEALLRKMNLEFTADKPSHENAGLRNRA